MKMKESFARVALVSMLSFGIVACAASMAAHKPEQENAPARDANVRAVIWRDPGPMASLNLIYGAGGKGHAPNPKGTFTFVREDLEAGSPKFEITDERGIEWKVKLGEEPQSETAASRLLWAAGYFVDEDYYLAEITVTGLPKLRRGDEFLSKDGVIHGARLERQLKGQEKRGTWDWFDNPFIDTRELNGLRIMMALLNNWDLKEVNNSIYEMPGERRYVVADLGATFGNTGNSLTRSKSTPREFADSEFVESANADTIDFVLHSRPFLLSVFNVPNYQTRTRMEEITTKIPRADVRWLARRLGSLSDRQVRDCFRAAGYATHEIEIYARAVRKRIAELSAL
jgi:hypothetical protein